MPGPEGLDGSRVQLPSGRWLHQLGELSQVTLPELAWVVAHYMLSHAEDGVFHGSVPTAIRATWPHQGEHPHQRSVARILRAHGFTPHQDPGGPFTWRVPAELPAWDMASSSGSRDTGEQTTGGPVRIRKLEPGQPAPPMWTRQMLTLAAAVYADPARHPREYAEQLGWNPTNVSQVAATLRRYGIIESRGARSAARYYPVHGVELPARARRYRPAARVRQGPAAPPAEPARTSDAPAPPPILDPMTADAELLELAGILRKIAALSSESRAWLVARLQAQEV